MSDPDAEANRRMAERQARDPKPLLVVPSAIEKHTGPDNLLYSELGNAYRLLTKSQGEIRYSPEWARWLKWDLNHWQIDHGDIQVRANAQLIGSDLRTQLDKALKPATLIDWSKRSETAAGITNMVNLARSLPGVCVKYNDLDADPWAFNTQNGLIDLRTSELHEPDPYTLVTKIAGCGYNPAATCPQFTQFLQEIFPDPEVVAYIQRFAGYCLTGDVSEQMIGIWWGAGRNGKSTLLTILAAILGDYAVTIGRELVTLQQLEGHDTKFVDLFRARLAVCVELKEHEHLDASRIKALTGGDKIRARRMREDYWNFEPTHKMVVATNHKPRAAASDFALWRRVHLVPFTTTVDESTVNPNLAAEIVCNEIEGVLAWAVEGCRLWASERLTAPQAVLEATTAYRNETDTVGAFIRETGITFVAGEVISTQALHSVHDEWSNDAGLNPPSHWQKVTAVLKEHGCEQIRTGGTRYWKGLKVG